MASDFGDESGQRLLDDFVRYGQQAGIERMRARAYAVRRACDHARGAARDVAGAGSEAELASGVGDPKEWAKLDMGEFQAIDDYGQIREVVESKLGAHGAEFHWHDGGDGREFLLFRVRDAREVWESFGEISREAGEACERAAAEIQRSAGREAARDGAELGDARPGADAPPGARHQAAHVGTRRAGDHAKTFAQKHGIPALKGFAARDARPLEERAAHARAASAALSRAGGGIVAPGRSAGPRMQEVRSK